MMKLIILSLALLLALNLIACDLITTSVSPQEVHDLINIERANHNLPVVRWDSRMQQFAQNQADAMAGEDRLFHSRRPALQGGENAWSGTGHSWSASDVVESWMGSSGHRAWILDRRVRQAGVGVSSSGGNTYVAWAFSERISVETSSDGVGRTRRTERTLPERRTERTVPDRSIDRSVRR